MKKEYEAPKVEKMDYDYTETVVASGGLTETSTEWWTCETRIVNVKNIENTVCGYL